MTKTLSANQHAEAMSDYITEGAKRALALNNRGPVLLDNHGVLKKHILDAYWKHGFYIFESVINTKELADLRQDIERVLDGAPSEPGSDTDRHGRLPVGNEFARPSFSFATPLSDPIGGTKKNKGRHPVKMLDPKPAEGAPVWTISNLAGNLQIMDSCLRLYGHPDLLAVASAVLGPDFVPYNEVTFIKEPGLGPSVAWHQDGTTHWGAEDWDLGSHGFNFMIQLYGSTPGNGVWVVPETHSKSRTDIRKLIAENKSERLQTAVPLVCQSGDVCIVNRQLVHGSFANTSTERRVTLNEGFFPRRRIEDVTTTQLNGKKETYTHNRIDKRSQIIQLAIDARRQYFTDEKSFIYEPFLGREADAQWNEGTRQSILKDYNLTDMYI